MSFLQEVQKISGAHYVLPKVGNMRVDVHAYLSELIQHTQVRHIKCIHWTASVECNSMVIAVCRRNQ